MNVELEKYLHKTTKDTYWINKQGISVANQFREKVMQSGDFLLEVI